MISNDLVQSGAEMIRAKTSSYFNFSQAFRHPSSTWKGAFLANRFVKGLTILLNSFMNLL